MKIIPDECVPSIVKRRLPERDIVTVQEMGWAGIKNGQLLRLVAAQFDVFITSDKNLRYQQNLAEVNVSIILLPSNQVPVVRQLLPEIEAAIAGIGSTVLIDLQQECRYAPGSISRDISGVMDKNQITSEPQIQIGGLKREKKADKVSA